ncbi:MAG: diaminopimelate epimerase [Candidatus Cloacimonetes bacterium]|jgi:diaminopimelate epimerase|nr:diaminopimelate epimerase [Candidatus Cloacimonadota bacterium]MDD4157489.1 diaminopimelate epimerase [Candidatus Cloacimonadota bacterium]
MLLKAIKMHGQGNDYIFFDITDIDCSQINWSSVSIKWSDRHFGIGADGIVLIDSNCEVDAKMRMFNNDGSEAEMCGTALRCVCKYLYLKLKKEILQINTLAGIKTCQYYPETDLIKAKIGNTKLLNDNLINIKIDDTEIQGYFLSIGNPHFVIINNVTIHNDIQYYGKILESWNTFPDKANIESVQIINKNHISVKVWERGTGITLACGTGSCASAFIAYKFYNLENIINVSLPGGEVNIEIKENNKCFLSGKVNQIFETFIEL